MEKKNYKKPMTNMREQAMAENQTKRRKKRKRNYLIHYVILTILVLAIGTTLSLTVFFNISEIIVEGNVTHSNEELIEYATVATGDNLFRTNLNTVEQGIKDNTVDIDEVKAERRLPNKLGIVITQATPAAAYQNGSLYYIVSTGGRIIASAETLEGYPDIVVFDGTPLASYQVGDFIHETEEYRELHEVITAINEVGIGKITAIGLDNQSEIKFCYDNRITVQLGSVIEINYKLLMTKKVIDDYVAEEEGVIDARKPTVAYFRPMTMEMQIADEIAVKTGNETGLPEDVGGEAGQNPDEPVTSDTDNVGGGSEN